MHTLFHIFDQIRQSNKKFLVLLITLIALTFFLALPTISKTGEIITAGLITLIILAGIYTTVYRKKYFYISAGIGALTILFHWLSVFEIDTFVASNLESYSSYFIYFFNILRLILYVVFFIFITVRLVLKIVKYRKVNSDVICGSISGYLLLGITSAFFMTMVEYLIPNSFAINSDITSREEVFQSLFYYSFVTLATIGYGDITPVTPLARTLSITLGISGQMYLTILVAILVSKYLNANNHDDS